MAAKRVVIAGGGVAALEAAIALREIAGDAPVITMVAPNPDFVYQPLSVGSPFALGATPRLLLSKVAEDLDLELVHASVESVGKDRAVLLAGGGFVAFDKLIVAMGAPRVPVYEHATTFRGENDVESVHGLVQDVEMGYAKRIAFVVPGGVAWSLPIYELALMTAQRAHEMNMQVELAVVTPEDKPLGVFGAPAADDVAKRLADAGIRVATSTTAEIPASGRVVLRPGAEEIECDRIIALPVTRGPEIAGLPDDGHGFIPIDTHARVGGVENIYAAGDGTNFPLKQGGIACQQADAAAEHIAWSLGLGPEPEPFRPVLRGRLLTGTRDQFIRHNVTARGDEPDASEQRPLWWPPTKVAGKYLGKYLAAPATDDLLEIPLRGYEYAGHWSGD